VLNDGDGSNFKLKYGGTNSTKLVSNSQTTALTCF